MSFKRKKIINVILILWLIQLVAICFHLYSIPSLLIIIIISVVGLRIAGQYDRIWLRQELKTTRLSYADVYTSRSWIAKKQYKLDQSIIRYAIIDNELSEEEQQETLYCVGYERGVQCILNDKEQQKLQKDNEKLIEENNALHQQIFDKGQEIQIAEENAKKWQERYNKLLQGKEKVCI